MPIFDQSYRSYQGELKRRFRWPVITAQELRILWGRRMFYFLVIGSVFHILLRVLQLYLFDFASVVPDGPFREIQEEMQRELQRRQGHGHDDFLAMAGSRLRDIGPWFFFDFLRLQGALVFLILLYSGTGLICNDFRNNLTEIYFSKPMTWKDYVMGKISTLLVVGILLTAVPGVFLLLLHNLFNASWHTVTETAWLVWPIFAFSLVLVLPMALAVLASSSLVNSARIAGIALFLIFFTDVTLGPLVAAILENEQLAVIAFPVAVNRLGELLFAESFNIVRVPWTASACFVTAVCAGALAIICRKARRAEIQL